MTTIVRLFFRSCPSTVCRAVTAIIINAVKSFASGTISHVSEKVFKFKPTFTNFDASSSIAIIGRIVGIGTAGKHSSPTFIQRCLPSARCIAVAIISFTRSILVQTSARVCISTTQIIAVGVNCFAAIATTKPDHASVFHLAADTEYYKAAEALSADIDQLSRHEVLQ